MISLTFQVWFADTIVRSRHTMTYVPVDDVSRQQDHRTWNLIAAMTPVLRRDRCLDVGWSCHSAICIKSGLGSRTDWGFWVDFCKVERQDLDSQTCWVWKDFNCIQVYIHYVYVLHVMCMCLWICVHLYPYLLIPHHGATYILASNGVGLLSLLSCLPPRVLHRRLPFRVEARWEVGKCVRAVVVQDRGLMFVVVLTQPKPIYNQNDDHDSGSIVISVISIFMYMYLHVAYTIPFELVGCSH